MQSKVREGEAKLEAAAQAQQQLQEQLDDSKRQLDAARVQVQQLQQQLQKEQDEKVGVPLANRWFYFPGRCACLRDACVQPDVAG